MVKEGRPSLTKKTINQIQAVELSGNKKDKVPKKAVIIQDNLSSSYDEN